MQDRSNEEEKPVSLAFLLVFFILTAVGIVFSVLCIYGAQNAFVEKWRVILCIVSALLFCAFCALSVVFTARKKQTHMKAMVSVYVFLLFSLIVLFILQKTGFFKVVQSSEALQEYLQGSGALMPLFYILLQYLQVVILPIPSVVSTVAGVALFGATKTFLYSLIGIVAGSFTAFYIGRRAGNKAVAWMVGEEALIKWQKKLKGKDNLVLTMMFLLPIFPDDILCFVAGLSTMSLRYFSGMMVISRVLALSATCYSIDLIPFNTWWGLMLWGIFLVGIVVAFIAIYKNLDKLQRFCKQWKNRKKSKKK